MVDVDEELAVLNAFADFAQPLEAGAVGGDDAVELLAASGFLQKSVGIQKAQLVGKRSSFQQATFLPWFLQGEGQAELGADAIAIGPDMADDANGLAVANAVENAIDDFRAGISCAGGDQEFFSSSSMISSTRLPRSTESSMTKRKLRRVFQHHGSADQPLNAFAVLCAA